MGAWGLGLFQSDHDHDRISDMYEPAGLDALEDKAYEMAKKAKRHSAGANSDNAPAGDDDEVDEGPRLSLYAGLCTDDTDIKLVRGHLDSGMLQKLINQKQTEIDEKAKGTDIEDEFERDRAVYDLILIGACAMSLGCKIPAKFKEVLIAKYRTTELQRDALGQMQVALGDGPDRYKEDVPYHFSGLKELPGDKEREDRIYPNSMLINVPAPFGMHRNTRPVAKREYPAHLCGGCGADRRFESDALLTCGRCKTTKYCGKVCQQAHFKEHRQACKQQ